MRRRGYGGDGLDIRHLVGPGHRVIHQRSGQQLTVVVVNRFFPEGLPGTLDNTSVNLAFDNHRINLRPAIVHRHIALETDVAIIRVHHDHRYVGSKGIGEVGRVIEGGCLQAGLHSFRHVPGHVGH